MGSTATVRDLLRAVRKLPADPPVDDPTVWYRTQKEHWIGWLRDYGGPGAYGRKTPSPSDARTVYNRIVDPQMLLWLIEAAGVEDELLTQARQEANDATSMQQASGRIRRRVAWDAVAQALWASCGRPGPAGRTSTRHR